MANKATRSPILGSFEDIGEQVKQEITQLPKDILGSALESVGLSTGGKSQQQQQHQQFEQPQDSSSPWHQIDQEKDNQTKKTIAREALRALVSSSEPKKQSVYDEKMQEEEQKKLMEKERQELEKRQHVALPSSGARKVPGIKSAIKSKQSNEIGKNVKQD